MLGFERRFVDALTATDDPAIRDGIVHWVSGSLATMPQHLRLGVLGQSVLLAGWVTLARTSMATLPASLERSPLMPLRQYVRLFRSLVLFAEQELTPVP